MSAPTQPALDGMPVPPVPQSECDWVLRKACGCPRGVATGEHHRTEDDAWKAFFDGWKAIAKAMQAGLRHGADAAFPVQHRGHAVPDVTARCPHEVTA